MFFYKVEKMTRASAPFPAEMRYNRARDGSLKIYLLKLCKLERVTKLFEAPARQRLKGDAGDDNHLWHLAVRNQKKNFSNFPNFSFKLSHHSHKDVERRSDEHEALVLAQRRARLEGEEHGLNYGKRLEAVKKREGFFP